ncbi:MAG: dehydratase [Devosia sp.]|nr:dehydratase [Devosia sp.]
MTRWYENIVLDEVFDLGQHTFGQNEIIRFAQAYDPQYFHLDPSLATHSHFGGIVASGWHTAAVGHGKMVDALEAEEAKLRAQGEEPGVSGPSPGGSKIEFPAPVRPGDTIRYALTVYDKRLSNSLPGWGLLFNRITAWNQHGKPVYLSEFVGFSKLRDYRPTLGTRVLLALIKLPLIGGWLKRRA